MTRRPEGDSSPSTHLCERAAYRRRARTPAEPPHPSQNLPAVRTESSGNIHASDALTHAKYPGGKDDMGMPSGNSVWSAPLFAFITREGIKMNSRVLAESPAWRLLSSRRSHISQ